MPFKCKYCKSQFCSEHRLPENHDCPKLELIEEERKKKEKEEPQWVTPQTTTPYYPQDDSLDIPEDAQIFQDDYDPVTGERIVRYYVPRVRRPDRPALGFSSRTEILHLIIGIFLMFESIFLIFFISFFENLSKYTKLYLIMAILGGLITGGFIGHELSHKFASIKLDYWAEFRLEKTYAILTAIIPYFVMPGAVQVASASASKEHMGKIAVAGPMFNLILGLIYMAIGFIFNFVFNNIGIGWIMAYSAFMNVMLGVFNLIPVYVLDGRKVIDWNKGVWIVTFLGLIGIILALTFIPWLGPGSPIGSIFISIPSDLYLTETQKMMRAFLSLINPYLPYFI